MADGRDVPVWDNHAQECRDAKRLPFEFKLDESMGGWMRKRVLDNLPLGSSVLDLGCGPGYWRKLFEGMQYTGLDQSTEMLKLAAELEPPVAAWVQGNGRTASTYFGPESFDMVFTASVTQHNRHYPDKEEIIQEIYKLLKPGGYYLFTENTYRADNCPQSVGNPDYTDGYSLTPAGWEKFVTNLGFEFLGFNGHGEYLFRKI